MATGMDFMGGNIMILGRGIPELGEDQHPTILRAEAIADYYEAFSSRVGRIVCSGGYSASLLTEQIPAKGAREADAMADTLVRNGVDHNKVVIEDDSVCTFTNFTQTIEHGLFDGYGIQEEGIVLGVGNAHGIRAKMISAQAFGVDSKKVHIIAPEKEGGFVNFGKEVILGAPVTHWALRDAEPGNLAHTHRARERFERNAARLNRKLNQRRAAAVLAKQ